jgi:Na+/melibiose symporter-like transporter
MYSAFMSMGLYVSSKLPTGPYRKANNPLQTHIFYLPFYFQAVKGTTAEGSGIRTIPYLGSIIISSIIVGGGITAIGWYKPFMIVGGAIFVVGCGLIYTLEIPSGAGKWIGYQLISGFGAGGGVQSISPLAYYVTTDANYPQYLSSPFKSS